MSKSPPNNRGQIAAPVPDTEAALDFLKWQCPEGPWVLTSISPGKGGIKTITADSAQKACAFIAEHNGKNNLYFSVNPLRATMNKKASRKDISHLAWLHVDIDARAGEDLEAERKRILSLLTNKLPKEVLTPSCIILSGNGYQAFWRLVEPLPIDGDLEKADDAALWNVALERALGGDSCHDISRIMRLPGTVNLPNAKKLAKGRVPVLAKWVHHSEDTYSLDQFEKADPLFAAPAPKNALVVVPEVLEAHRIEELSELDEWNVPNRVKIIISEGRDKDNPKPNNDTRSEWVFDAVCQLVRCGVPDDIILGILLDKDWRISESVLERGSGAQKYACRQIENARDKVARDEANPADHAALLAGSRRRPKTSHYICPRQGNPNPPHPGAWLQDTLS